MATYDKQKYGKWAVDRLKVMLQSRGSNAIVTKYKHENDNVLVMRLSVPLSEYSRDVIAKLSDLYEKLGASKIDFITNMEEVIVRVTKTQAQIPVLVPRFQRHAELSLPLGLNTDTGEEVWLNLKHNPHILIAGSTGKGKSVCLDNMIMHIDEFFDDTRFILVDPKKIELSAYENLPKTLKMLTEPETAILELQAICAQMDNRYREMRKLGTKDFRRLHEPRLFVIIDEYADLMMTSSKQKDENGQPVTLERVICRIAQLGRAAGIHLIIATQRPSADVITGLIKNNIPTRIAFGVGGAVDSRIILDECGAEKLPAAGYGILRNEEGMQTFKGVFIQEQQRTDYLSKYPKFTTRIVSNESLPPEAIYVPKQIESSFYGLSESDIREYLKGVTVYRNIQAVEDLGLTHGQANELGQMLDVQGIVKPKGRQRLVIDPMKFSIKNF